MIPSKCQIFKMNLQLFAEEEENNPVNPLLEEDYIDENSSEPTFSEPMPDNLEGQAQEPPAGAPNPQGDGGIKEYFDQKLSGLENLLLQSQVNNSASSGQVLNTETAQAESPEDEIVALLGRSKEELEDDFFKDPISMVMNLAEKIADKRYKPIVEEMETQRSMQAMESYVNQFLQDNPDAIEHLDKIQRIIEERPYLNDKPEALEMAYKMAKFEDLNSRPAYKEEDILKDEAIRDKIIKDYLANVEKQNSEAPIGINKSSGSSALSPQDTPKTLKEASKMFLSSLD